MSLATIVSLVVMYWLSVLANYIVYTFLHCVPFCSAWLFTDGAYVGVAHLLIATLCISAVMMVGYLGYLIVDNWIVRYRTYVEEQYRSDIFMGMDADKTPDGYIALEKYNHH